MQPKGFLGPDQYRAIVDKLLQVNNPISYLKAAGADWSTLNPDWLQQINNEITRRQVRELAVMDQLFRANPNMSFEAGKTSRYKALETLQDVVDVVGKYIDQRATLPQKEQPKAPSERRRLTIRVLAIAYYFGGYPRGDNSHYLDYLDKYNNDGQASTLRKRVADITGYIERGNISPPWLNEDNLNHARQILLDDDKDLQSIDNELDKLKKQVRSLLRSRKER